MTSPSPRRRGIIIVAVLFVGLALLGLMLGRFAALQREVIPVSSAAETMMVFDELGSSRDAWAEIYPVVPRMGLTHWPEGWSDEIDVETKKTLFLMAMAPLALRANETIIEDRERLLSLRDPQDLGTRDARWLSELALRYKVISSENAEIGPDEIARLKRLVDVIPASLVLAQAAIESGWGTSRFATEANALFGQWTWEDDGMVPSEQRGELGDYRIKSFPTPLYSVAAYMLNLNSHAAYSGLRDRRGGLREAGQTVSGLELAATLTAYSERGQAYVDELSGLINGNGLSNLDEADLSRGGLVVIKPFGAWAQP